ncbi:MAG: twin-arginine translocase TatA/TatE family subunit [Planctomycetaceae bacterium]|nr:twin-arginine translocase TatA/TatE family subunit [Planctomycetaceae bacterium]
MLPLFSWLTPSPMELIVIAGIGLLLFGNRLPQVMRSLGKSVVEFKKGVNGIEDDIEAATREKSSSNEQA